MTLVSLPGSVPFKRRRIDGLACWMTRKADSRARGLGCGHVGHERSRADPAYSRVGPGGIASAAARLLGSGGRGNTRRVTALAFAA